MKKIFIDYEKLLRGGGAGAIECSYAMHPDNRGMIRLCEEIAFMFACRRCEDYPCVNACPNGALKREDDLIRRSSFMCISCKNCSMACPFGTILPESVPYLVSRCDTCLNRLAPGGVPLCVRTCPDDSIRLVEEEEVKEDKNVHALGNVILVRVVDWRELNGVRR